MYFHNFIKISVKLCKISEILIQQNFTGKCVSVDKTYHLERQKISILQNFHRLSPEFLKKFGGNS